MPAYEAFIISGPTFSTSHSAGQTYSVGAQVTFTIDHSDTTSNNENQLTEDGWNTTNGGGATPNNGDHVSVNAGAFSGLDHLSVPNGMTITMSDGSVINFTTPMLLRLEDGTMLMVPYTTGQNTTLNTALDSGLTPTSLAVENTGSSSSVGLGTSALRVMPNDGIIEGTAGDDVIDESYFSDPQDDRVDNNDAVLGVGDEDSIIGGGGSDTIYGGAANDTIEGDGTLPAGGTSADGNDVIYGGGGDDSISGSGGDDVLYGDGEGPGAIGDGSFDGDYGSSNNTIGNLPTPIAGIFDGNSSTTADYRDAASRVGTPEDIVDPTDQGGYIRFISFQSSRELVGFELGTPILAGETYTITFDGALGATNSGSFLYQAKQFLTLFEDSNFVGSVNQCSKIESAEYRTNGKISRSYPEVHDGERFALFG